MINANQTAPLGELLQMGQTADVSEVRREDDRGSFVHGFLCDISEYLNAEEVADFSLVSRATNRYMSMRTPAIGAHPILDDQSISPRERGFYGHQDDFTAHEIKSEQKKASRIMRRYLPLNVEDTFSARRLALREQYRDLRGRLAVVNASMAFIEINSYLSSEEKASERARLRGSFRELRNQSIQLEHAVSGVMDRLMDGREPRLELQSDFFRGRRGWR